MSNHSEELTHDSIETSDDFEFALAETGSEVSFEESHANDDSANSESGINQSENPVTDNNERQSDSTENAIANKSNNDTLNSGQVTSNHVDQNDCHDQTAQPPACDKHALLPVVVDSTESTAFIDLFNTGGEMAVEVPADNAVSCNDIALNDSNQDQTLSMIQSKLAADEVAKMNAKGQIEVTKTVADDCQITYVYGETPVPKNPLYEVKLNDLVSGNLPFRENANKDRAFLVRVDGVFKEIVFSAQLMNGLFALNQPALRKNPVMDKCFIKALIIGICTIRAIRDDAIAINKDILAFMKGTRKQHTKRILT